MRDKAMAMEYLKGKEEDSGIMTIAKERADLEGIDRPKKPDEFLEVLKIEIKQLDVLIEESDDDEEKAGAVNKKARVEVVVEKLQKMGVGKGGGAEEETEEKPKEEKSDEEKSEEESEESDEESDEDSSDEESDKDEELEDNGQDANFNLESDMFDSSPSMLIKELAEVMLLEAAARDMGIEVEPLSGDQVSSEQNRGWTFSIPSNKILKWVTKVNRLNINRGRLDLQSPHQRDIVKDLDKPVFDWLEIFDSDGEQIYYED